MTEYGGILGAPVLVHSNGPDNRGPHMPMTDEERRQAKRAANKRHYEANREEQLERMRAWKGRNPDKAAEASRRWQAANPIRALLNQCKCNARQRGLPFDLTLSLVEGLLSNMTCSATGLPLSFARVKGERYARSPWYPSIDRLDNSRGYVPGNVRAVCSIYNFMRSNHSDDDVLAVARALVARHG